MTKRAVMGELTTIEIAESPAGALEQEKQQLARNDGVRRLGSWAIHRNAVAPNAEGSFSASDLFVRRNPISVFRTRFATARPMPSSTPAVRAADLDRKRKTSTR